MLLIDLCVAAALDSVKASVTLPWGDTKTPTEGTADELGEAEARVLVVEKDAGACDESPASTDPPLVSAAEPPLPSSSSSTDADSAPPETDTESTSPETEATPEHPRRVIALSNFEKALKEITPSSSESLGTLSELRKWNDEFGEGKREKRRNMWGKGSFGFVEKGEGRGEIKVAAAAGVGSTSGGGSGSSSSA